jgi:glutamate racemase
MPNSAPIGIFDSGIGGLTLAHAITELMPQENIIYFGDTAHLPYGDKSATAIQAYSVKICNLLLEKNCKLILIACNSASAAAYDLVKAYVGTKAKVVNVIDPVISYLDQNWENKTLGLIGTKQTDLCEQGGSVGKAYPGEVFGHSFISTHDRRRLLLELHL